MHSLSTQSQFMIITVFLFRFIFLNQECATPGRGLVTRSLSTRPLPRLGSGQWRTAPRSARGTAPATLSRTGQCPPHDQNILNGSLHFSYSGVTSITGDNCILSSEDVARLVNNNDVLVDDNWDLYQRVEGGYNCRGAQTGERIIRDIIPG